MGFSARQVCTALQTYLVDSLISEILLFIVPHIFQTLSADFLKKKRYVVSHVFAANAMVYIAPLLAEIHGTTQSLGRSWLISPD